MIKLWFAPRTRAVRVAWLLEELGLPYELQRVEFEATATAFFAQKTPLGKLPVIDDEGLILAESGAIVEYILEQYGRGRLAPAPGTPARARYLQWLHFAESTAFPPLGIVVWMTLYRDDAAAHPELVQDAIGRAASGLEFLETHFGVGPWLLGEDFSAADIMMGFTLFAAQAVGVLDSRFPIINAYLSRLQERPALQKVLDL
ncbi:MAG: glutathione S-transferase family protein [Pseudomonadales bacterium]|nr:glutathione S-transferase family protein [Halioglobus sp.]MCP5130632.1 glutathione S-transferase family protein [Pseudomonadales bacterium]